MLPRRTRAATAEQSAASTRSKVQKVNNVTQDAAKSTQKIRQSRRKKKIVKNNLDTSAEQSDERKTSDVRSAIKRTTKKKTIRHRLKLNDETETEDVDQDVNKSLKSSKKKRINNRRMKALDNLSPLSISKDSNLEKMSDTNLQQKMYINLSPTVVTPKSTPPKLSFTPHRSKKTPKKSPITLGSPKTHSRTVPKLLKSPRKLSLATGNDSSEENSEIFNSNYPAKKLRKTKQNYVSNSSASDRSASLSPKRKKKHKTSDKDSKVLLPKFSKSPKIVLKYSKSKKSKSHKLKLFSSPKIERSTLKSLSLKRKNSPSVERLISKSKLSKTLTLSEIQNMLTGPVVLLEKLSLEDLKQKNKQSKSPLNTSINIKSPSIKINSNSKIIKKSSISTPTKRNSTSKSRNNSAEKSRFSNNKRMSPRIKHNAQIEKQNASPLPLMSSTPNKKKVDATSNSPIALVNNTSFNTKSKRQSNVRLSNSLNKNSDIENISKPSIFDKEVYETSQDLFSHDSSYEKNNTSKKEQEDHKNNTYELDQPQILNIQKIKKRSSIAAKLSLENNTNKKAKVHFADTTCNGNSAQKSISKFNVSRSNKNGITNLASRSKVGSPKLLKNSLNPSFKISSPRTDKKLVKIQLKGIQVTPKSFNTTEKKSEKKSSTKKVPNFDKIHKQMFAKSESLVDAKNRLKARHLAFTANTTVSTANLKVEGKKPLLTETKDGVHNRFGFKLRKPEATNIIVKKQVVYSREKKQRNTWMMLQGVRTNRRFELQMKARNLNL